MKHGRMKDAGSSQIPWNDLQRKQEPAGRKEQKNG